MFISNLLMIAGYLAPVAMMITGCETYNKSVRAEAGMANQGDAAFEGMSEADAADLPQ